MKTARLNGRIIKIESISEVDKDLVYRCRNKNCDCEVRVYAFEEIKQSKHFRSTTGHIDGCYMEKISSKLEKSSSLKNILNVTKKWTLKDIYIMVQTFDLEDEIIDDLKLKDIEISSRNEIKELDYDKTYILIATPTSDLRKNKKGKSSFFGELKDMKVIINYDKEINRKIFEEKSKNSIIILVGKVQRSTKNEKFYLIFDVDEKNIDFINNQ